MFDNLSRPPFIWWCTSIRRQADRVDTGPSAASDELVTTTEAQATHASGCSGARCTWKRRRLRIRSSPRQSFEQAVDPHQRTTSLAGDVMQVVIAQRLSRAVQRTKAIGFVSRAAQPQSIALYVLSSISAIFMSPVPHRKFWCVLKARPWLPCGRSPAPDSRGDDESAGSSRWKRNCWPIRRSAPSI